MIDDDRIPNCDPIWSLSLLCFVVFTDVDVRALLGVVQWKVHASCIRLSAPYGTNADNNVG